MERKPYPPTYTGVQQAMGDLPKKQAVQCGLSVRWRKTTVLTCHRAPKHAGCHLDVDNDVWFDKYEGKWHIMPRQPEAPGRQGPTRKGK